ncbi:MAG: HI1506-related protein [Gammaproteobacteria bacterium]
MPDQLRVIAKREGFRRAGRAWSQTPTVVDIAEFTPEQLQQLEDEALLIVERISEPDKGKKAKE